MRQKKKISQRLHAKKRFLERLDMVITTADIDGMVKSIQANKAKFVERQSNRRSLWDVEFASKILRVVYDNRTKVVVTVLPTKENNSCQQQTA